MLRRLRRNEAANTAALEMMLATQEGAGRALVQMYAAATDTMIEYFRASVRDTVVMLAHQTLDCDSVRYRLTARFASNTIRVTRFTRSDEDGRWRTNENDDVVILASHPRDLFYRTAYIVRCLRKTGSRTTYEKMCRLICQTSAFVGECVTLMGSGYAT